MAALISNATVPLPTTAEVVSLFLSGRAPSTVTAYQADLNNFSEFLGTEASNEAARTFLSHGPGHANRLALEYKASLLDRGLSSAAINRKLATLRILTKLARMLGLIAWHLEVENIPVAPYRDTRGPSHSGFKSILRQSGNRTDPKGIRDKAILCLLHDVALRRGEVVSLDLCDVDLDNRTITVTRPPGSGLGS